MRYKRMFGVQNSLQIIKQYIICLLYTSDAADEL